MNFGQPGFTEVPIVWYFVDETTPHLGIPTPYCSRNWQALEKHEGGPLGEVIGADRPWSNGAPPIATPTAGVPCGTAEQWLGTAPLIDVPLTLGFPDCCLPITPPLTQQNGAVVIAGETFVVPAIIDLAVVLAGDLVVVEVIDGAAVLAGREVEVEVLAPAAVLAGDQVGVLELVGGEVLAGQSLEVLELEGGEVLAGDQVGVLELEGGEVLAGDQVGVLELIGGEVLAGQSLEVLELEGGEVLAGEIHAGGIAFAELASTIAGDLVNFEVLDVGTVLLAGEVVGVKSLG